VPGGPGQLVVAIPVRRVRDRVALALDGRLDVPPAPFVVAWSWRPEARRPRVVLVDDREDAPVQFSLEVVAAGTLRDVAPQFGGFLRVDDKGRPAANEARAIFEMIPVEELDVARRAKRVDARATLQHLDVDGVLPVGLPEDRGPVRFARGVDGRLYGHGDL
jgi:hypothetical protein